MGLSARQRRRTGTGGFSEEAQLALRIRMDPVWFFREVLGFEPWEMQQRIALSVRDNRRTMVPSCHGAGKSKIAAALVLWFMLGYPGCKVATTAPSLRQVKNIIWANLRQMHEQAKFPLWGEPLTTRWELEPEWYAFGFTTKEPDAVSGIHAPEIFVLLDEATGIPKVIWEAIKGLDSSAWPRLLGIGNPTDPTSGFKEECDRLEERNPEGLIRISAFDTPNLKAGKTIIGGLTTSEWVDERKLDWGEESPLYVAKVLGRFPDQADDALVRMSWAEDAKRAEFEPGEPRVLAVDVARKGSNRTVAYLREGNRFRCVLRKMGLLVTDIRDAVCELAVKHDPEQIVVDDSGVGGGVTDVVAERLREQGRKIHVEAFNGANTANDERKFYNRRAETFWLLREMFREGQVDLDEDASDDVISQLTSIRYTTRVKGHNDVIIIESKDQMEGRNMPSPDDADAMMMTVAPARRRKLIMVGWGS